jgi:hypothetical protein
MIIPRWRQIKSKIKMENLPAAGGRETNEVVAARRQLRNLDCRQTSFQFFVLLFEFLWMKCPVSVRLSSGFTTAFDVGNCCSAGRAGR